MAWTTPTVRATGDLITASIWNGDLGDNLKYLHGDAGRVTINNGLKAASTAALGIPILEVNNTVAGKTFGFYLADDGVARFTFDGVLDNIITVDSSGVVKTGAALMRVHRHPFANDRHVESGKAAYTTNGSGVATGSVTFTDAFTAAPVVCLTAEQTGANEVRAFITAISTTGFSWQTAGASAVSGNIHWAAEGPD